MKLHSLIRVILTVAHTAAALVDNYSAARQMEKLLLKLLSLSGGAALLRFKQLRTALESCFRVLPPLQVFCIGENEAEMSAGGAAMAGATPRGARAAPKLVSASPGCQPRTKSDQCRYVAVHATVGVG